MDISPIVRVVATVVGVGAVLGAGLAAAAQKFAVEVNPKISEVEETLPGINCGACGYPGCSSYAEAVATEEDVFYSFIIPVNPINAIASNPVVMNAMGIPFKGSGTSASSSLSLM